jgi:hypothetical protein
VVDASFLCHYHIVWGPWTSRDALCFLGNVTPYLLLGDLGTGTRGFKERKRLGPFNETGSREIQTDVRFLENCVMEQRR